MRGCSGLILTIFLSATPLLGQPRLNPTVTVLPQAQSPLPPECVDTAAPRPLPRPPIAEIPVPRTAEPVSAPRADLRSTLREVQGAAAARDREGFLQALASAKTMLNATPPGAERNAAAEVIAVYDDVARLWDYQWTTAAGAFFDSSSAGGALLKSLMRYPGYEEFARRNSIVDSNGVRHYPTRESIDFLLGLAADRLSRAGVPLDRRAEVRRPATPPPAPVPATAQPRLERPAPARGETAAPSRPRTKSAPVRGAAAPRKAPAPSPADAEVPVPPGLVSQPAVATTTALPTDTAPAVSTVSPAIPPAVTDPAVTATTAEQAPPAQVPRPARGRSIIMPIVLILIGVGVLILLFRASS